MSAVVAARVGVHEESRIDVPGNGVVSALFDEPAHARCGFVLAHGAGAGMRHAFLDELARRLVGHGIAVLRYQFPAMERGSRRPESPAVAHATVRAAVQAAASRWPGLPLFAGGKSFGGRMTSQAQALEPLAGVFGLDFIGFPLHAAGCPSVVRAEHLGKVEIPMLFLQGSRDALADLALIVQVTRALPTADVVVIDDADHAFHVRRASGSDDAAALDRIAATMANWMEEIVATRPAIAPARSRVRG